MSKTMLKDKKTQNEDNFLYEYEHKVENELIIQNSLKKTCKL